MPIHPTIFRIIAPTLGNPFGLPVYGGVLLPPVSDALLVLLKGDDDGDAQKLDSWKKPDAENFDIVQSACASLNGTDEFGTHNKGFVLESGVPTIFQCKFDALANQTVVDTLPTAGNGIGSYINFRDNGRCFVRFGDETVNEIFWSTGGVLDYEAGTPYTFSLTVEANGDFELLQNGSVWVSGNTQYVPDGVSEVDCELGKSLASNYFCGQLYDITIASIHFRTAENSGLTSFSDDYLNDGHSIAWTASVDTLWAQRQDSYFANAIDGWWEINGDDTLYPYPVVGFDTYHAGGTFNGSEQSIGPEEFPVGAPNGVDDTFTMLADRGTIVSYGGDGLSVPTYVHPTITFTAGIIRDTLFSDGTLLQVNEGTGTDLYNSDGVLTATLNGTPAFWEGEPMVSQAIGDAEAASTSGNYLTDGKYHALYMTQQAWGELGSELVDDTYFNDPTQWNTTGVIVSNGKATLTVVAGVNAYITQTQLAFVDETEYEIRIDATRISGAGRITLTRDAGANMPGAPIIALSGVTVVRFVHTDGDRANIGIKRFDTSGDYVWEINDFSVREVNQVMNKNKQYYFCAEAGLFINKNVLTDAEHLEYIEFLYNNCYQEFEALINSETGNMIYNELTSNIIYDEEA